MFTTNTIYINSSIDHIYRLACDIDNWPSILPHYRSVKILEQSSDRNRKVADMHAVRSINNRLAIPVSWHSVQICEPETYRIYYKHIAGATMGMWVVWTLEADPWDRGVLVTITHNLRYPFVPMNGWFANIIIGEGFVYYIAGHTLSALKAFAES